MIYVEAIEGELMTDQVHMRDFSRKRRPVYFTISEVTYHCVKALPADELQEMMNRLRGSNVDDTNAVARVIDVLQVCMIGDSHAALVTKIKTDRDDPIDLEQLGEIVEWLVEVYTNRPTKPSSGSSTGSPSDDGGTSSTAGAPLVVSHPSSSTELAS